MRDLCGEKWELIAKRVCTVRSLYPIIVTGENVLGLGCVKGCGVVGMCTAHSPGGSHAGLFLFLHALTSDAKMKECSVYLGLRV